jgi:2-oxoglutarate ferredoxin oxidoreductase subunit beta
MARLERAHGVEIAEGHPLDEILRADRLPLVWCPGCGLGIVTNCFTESVARSGIPIEKHVVVTGTGCASPLLSYLKLETYRSIHGGAIPFASGLKIANPELEVTLLVCDSDLIGADMNHLIHAIRRNVDLNVFCVNNLNYGMTGGEFDSASPRARRETAPRASFEASFNLPYVVASAGAAFVSRWTTIHIRQLLEAMQRAFQVRGLAFLDIIAPCPPGFSESGNFEDGHAMMQYFRTCSRVDNSADLSKIGFSINPPEPMVVGNFVDHREPTYDELQYAMVREDGRAAT